MDSTIRVPVTRMPGGDAEDALAVEEPLEIRVGERPLAVTMRTPGHDFDLAAGFLFTEGVIPSYAAIDGIRHWGSPNVVRVALREGVTIDWQRFQRHFYATSSCGVCGKASIELVRVHARRVTPLPFDPALIPTLPDRLRAQQSMFEETGGIHGAGLFTADGTLVVAREDIGRHNAVDKAIGALGQAGTPLADKVLVVSGRAGFEIVQKAAVASIPAIVAVGAPSSLAVELAAEFGLTLIGFAREGRFTVYAGR